ncbi:MAG: metallophosphoesterase, partial [Terriglobales bacterium]
MPCRARRIALRLLLLSLFVVSLACQASNPRVVAVGDAHGDIGRLSELLHDAGLASDGRWVGGAATLVQTGDMIDRGPADRAVLDLMMVLEKEAPRQKGKVIVRLGNHEVMNLIGDLRYVGSFASYADQDSEKRQRRAFEQYLEWRKDHTQPTEASLSDAEVEKQWMNAHPIGFMEQRDAFAPDGKYGRWLREKDAVGRVGDTLFVHGGINPELPNTDPDGINQRIRSELKAFD